MSVLQAYQADLLKELDEREQVSSDYITELRRTADLSLRATKESARAIGRFMAAMVAAERHLWLTLSVMENLDRVCLLDAPLSSSGLFGDAVKSVVDGASGGIPAVPPSPLSGSGGCWAAALDEYRLLIQGGSKGERCLSRSPAAEPEAALLVWDFKVEAGSEIRAYG